MKIEIGESLIYSWLRHAKGCQVVQTNWKLSNTWDLLNEEILQDLMAKSNTLFRDKYGYSVYKNNNSLAQLLAQAEIDAIGISFEEGIQTIYAVDVAFHEAGLNYGSKDETIMRVVKKCMRTAMCIYGCFGVRNAEILFASPKVHNAVINELLPCIDNVQTILINAGLNYRVRVIANDEFGEKIIDPVVAVMGNVADTSELFMRSLQMYNMFANRKTTIVEALKARNVKRKDTEPYLPDKIEVADYEGLSEMKIGVFVRTILTQMLENSEISPEEIKLMQTLEYSKKTFDINYPLLRKASLSNGEKVPRYWAKEVASHGEGYFICSEWYETPINNDRPYFIKWFGLHHPK